MPELDPDDWSLENFTNVTSSHLSAVRYYRNYEILYVQFTDGSVWRYDGVEWGVYLGLRRAWSKGEYFHDNIRMSYNYERVD